MDCSNPHLAKRMIDRGFTENDLREMLERAHGFRPDRDPGRWVIETMFLRRAWEVIIEPQIDEELLVVVTAYAVG